MSLTILAIASAISLSGCATPATPATHGPASGAPNGGEAALCRADAVAALVGQSAPTDADIMGRTGAAKIRRIAPGDITTKEFFADRVTVTIDPATARIVAASCG